MKRSVVFNIVDAGVAHDGVSSGSNVNTDLFVRFKIHIAYTYISGLAFFPCCFILLD